MPASAIDRARLFFTLRMIQMCFFAYPFTHIFRVKSGNVLKGPDQIEHVSEVKFFNCILRKLNMSVCRRRTRSYDVSNLEFAIRTLAKHWLLRRKKF